MKCSHFLICCSSNAAIKLNQCSQATKLEWRLIIWKIKKWYRRHLGLSRHFDFLAWQKCYYFYIALELQHIKKLKHFIQQLLYNKILKNIIFHIKLFRHFEFSRKKFFHFCPKYKKKTKVKYNFWKYLYEKLEKPKLCVSQFSKNRKLYLTLGPGVFFCII
jgi:hypothetical protein